MDQPCHKFFHASEMLFADERREYPLSLYRNIGIMAHIDAGKVGGHRGSSVSRDWNTSP